MCINATEMMVQIARTVISSCFLLFQMIEFYFTLFIYFCIKNPPSLACIILIAAYIRMYTHLNPHLKIQNSKDKNMQFNRWTS